MEPPHAMYNQAGPSNFVNGYAHDARPPPHFAPGRGRGHTASHRNVNQNSMYHQPQLQPQPYYSPNLHVPPYSGYPMQVNGMNGAPVNGHYSHGQTSAPLPRRVGPVLQPANYQPPASPALRPTNVYNPHVPPYIPSIPPQASSPMYYYPHALPHMQPYSTAHTPPLHTPYPHPNPQNMKSPLISPLSEQVMGSPRLGKVHASSSPQPVQLSSAPLFLLQESQPIPLLPNPIADVHPNVIDSLQPLAQQVVSNEPQELLASRTQSPIKESPMSTKPELTSLDSETAPQQEWVISTFRPDDPADAIGIMISPKARPPAQIIRRAIAYHLPIRSRVRSSSKDAQVGYLSSVPDIAEREDLSSATVSSHTEPISGSGTETESRVSSAPDVLAFESPLSTATSVSLPHSKVDSLVENDTSSSVSALSPSPKACSPKSAASAILLSPIASPPSTSPSFVKKSWASLLRPEGSSDSKSSLPTSSVIGFSAPAAGADATPSPGPSSPAGRNGLFHLLTKGPSGSEGVPQVRPRGLVNTGNMCFANAVLQTLVYTRPFYRLFTELGNYVSGTGAVSTLWNGKATPLVDATVEFLKEFKPKAKGSSKDKYEGEDDFDNIDSFIPSYVYDAMKEKSRFDSMGGGQQEDAEEFLGFFLDTIEEELLTIYSSLKIGSQSKSQTQTQGSADDDVWLEIGKKNKAVVTRTTKSVDSPMTYIFGGKFRSILRVPGQRDSVMVEDWRSLQLDIQRDQVNSIEDALQYISHPQQVQMSSVTKGGTIVDATQQVLVEVLPPILVLHLKRFLYDTTAKDVVKLHKQIAFGQELEIPANAITPARRTSHPVKYKLFAVLYHHGQSAAGGHYTLDVLHPNRNADLHVAPREGWIRIDDELVSDLREQDVFGSERDCAYLLFYRRVAAPRSYARAGQGT